MHPFPEISIPEDIYGMEDFGPADTNVQNAAHNIDEGPKTAIDLASSVFHQEYEEFELRIFHRKNRFTIQYLFYLFLPNNYLDILVCSCDRILLQDWL